MSLWLARDQKSNDVVALQYALNAARPGKPALALDGIFGPLTEAAVHDFQKHAGAGLTADGIAGPHTLDALFAGVDVQTTIAVRRAAPRLGSKWLPLPPAEPATPAGLSFGTIGLLQRELQVRNWLSDGFPKAPLALAPLPRLPPLDLDAMKRREIAVHRLSLSGHREAGRRFAGFRGFAFEMEATGSTSDFEEGEYAFSFKLLQPKLDGFFKPSVSLKASPDGGWTATTKVSVTPFKILEGDWKRWSVEAKPLIAASVTTPFILGDDPKRPFPKLKVFAGAEAEVTFAPIRRARNFRLFFGGRFGAHGFLEFKDRRIDGGFVAPDLELEGGVRVRFGPGSKEE